MPHRIWLLAVAVLSGWVTLFAVTYLVERPLLYLTAPLLGGGWVPTTQLLLDCFALAASGWVVGYVMRRLRESRVMTGVLVFAAMLGVWNFGLVPGIDLPWLIRLVADTFHDARFFDGLVTAVTTHALLFGCLIVGGLLSRPRSVPPSIAGSS